MKVFNLRCGSGHSFEGWFGSEADYDGQLQRGLLECPLCANPQVVRVPSAPRLNLNASPSQASVTDEVANHAHDSDGHVLAALRQLVQQSQDVGPRFADQARRMHNGELPQRAIRGEATAKQFEELLDDGVPVLPLPNIPGLKEPLQ
jgi:hypothetical protein